LINIDFLDAGCADAIHINFIGSDNKPHNILIDGGSEKGNLYEKGLRKRIYEIVNIKKEIIDIWIITHIDDDHIGGILRLLKDTELLEAVDLSRTTFWFNYSNWDYDSGIRTNNLKNVKQGITLRNYILENSNIKESITDDNIIDLWGATATILSPNNQKYNSLLNVWKNAEIKIRESETSSLKTNRKNDYNTKVEDFDISKEVKDASVENGSSLSFILQFNNESILFSADSHSDTLACSINRICKDRKLKLKYMQIPHHGSRYNISNSLLELIDCEDYIISADGFNRSNLPNKETLVKVLHANPDKIINFHITQENELTRNIFKVDKDSQINLKFPDQGKNHLHFTIG
jgi:beta-lactamase superfamily II metal-dependent hydrolase